MSDATDPNPGEATAQQFTAGESLPDEPVAGGPREPVHPLPPTPDGERPKKQRSNLALRLLSAAILIPLVCGCIYAGGLWLLGLIVAFILIGVNEFYHLIEAKGAEPLRSVGYAAAGALPVVFYFGSDYQATVLMSFVLLGMLVAQLGKAQIAESLASISGTFFGVFYVGWLGSHAIALRNFQPVVADRWGTPELLEMHPDVGGYYLFLTIAIVIGGDVGAYFAGRSYGKRKLAPQISPNKTVEGAIGGLIAGLGVGAACKLGFDTFAPQLSANLGWLTTLIWAPLLAAAGIVGDLVESLLKRDAQVKDTGTLLPGMGGILDRIDSNLIAFPVMYYFLLALTYLSQPVAVLPPLAVAVGP